MPSQIELFLKPYSQQEVNYQTAFETKVADKIDESKRCEHTVLKLDFIGRVSINRHESHLSSNKETRLILPKDVFSRNSSEFFSRLTQLNLEKNGLTEIPDGSFDLLFALKEISLRANRLRKLPKTLFSKLPALEIINLGENNLKTLDKKQFESQQSLTQLHLNHQNSEFTIPAEILAPHTALTLLILDNNRRLKISQKAFQSLNNLEILGLNGIKNLGKTLKNNPEFLLQFPNLKKVRLSNNVLEKFPALPLNIVYIEASRCELEEFPLEDIKRYSSLQYLDIYGNQFEAPSRATIPTTVKTYISENTLNEAANVDREAFSSHA